MQVGGFQYLHLIKAIQGKRFQIGNNRGRVNGWIGEKLVLPSVNPIRVARKPDDSLLAKAMTQFPEDSWIMYIAITLNDAPSEAARERDKGGVRTR